MKKLMLMFLLGGMILSSLLILLGGEILSSSKVEQKVESKVEPQTERKIESKTESQGEWQKDYNAAAKTAAEQKKPMMLLFTAPAWCGYCIRMEKNLFPQEGFKAVMAKTVPVMLDFSKQSDVTQEMRDLAKKYNVRGYPTLVVTDAQGKVLGTKVGFGGNVETYIKDLNSYIGN